MRYQIQQRVFSLRDRFDIWDEHGQPVFQAKSHLLSIGQSIDLLDNTGMQVAHIQQRVLTFHPEYEISRGGQVVAVVQKKLFTLIHDRFTIEGAAGTFEMTGDWLNWNLDDHAKRADRSTDWQAIRSISRQIRRRYCRGSRYTDEPSAWLLSWTK